MPRGRGRIERFFSTLAQLSGYAPAGGAVKGKPVLKITLHNLHSDRLSLFVLVRKLFLIMYLGIIPRALSHYRTINKDVCTGESGCLKNPGIRDPKRVLDSTPLHSQIVQIGAH